MNQQPNDYPAAPSEPDFDEAREVAADTQRVIMDAAMAAAVADAISPVEQRRAVEEAQQHNDAALKRLAAQGFSITELSVMSVRMQMLIEHLLGDMDMPRRLDYETAVQAKFSELIAEASTQITRAKLLDGVRLDPRQQRPGG